VIFIEPVVYGIQPIIEATFHADGKKADAIPGKIGHRFLPHSAFHRGIYGGDILGR
jgi:hypothetical protein